MLGQKNIYQKFFSKKSLFLGGTKNRDKNFWGQRKFVKKIFGSKKFLGQNLGQNHGQGAVQM